MGKIPVMEGFSASGLVSLRRGGQRDKLPTKCRVPLTFKRQLEKVEYAALLTWNRQGIRADSTQQPVRLPAEFRVLSYSQKMSGPASSGINSRQNVGCCFDMHQKLF